MFWHTIDTHHKKIVMILMILVALLSCIIVLSYGNYFLLGDPIRPNNDDVKYIQSARIFLNEGVLAYNTGNLPSAFIMPGMTLLLAGFMSIFGQGEAAIIAFRLFQVLEQALCIYLIYWLGKRFFNVRVGVIASIISALYLPDYFTAGVILSEMTFRTLLLLLICATVFALERKQAKWYIGIGLLTAAAAYFKPQISLYPAIFLLLWWKDRLPWRHMLKCMSLLGVVYVVCLLPWWIRNYNVFHELIIFTNSGGSPFLLGTRIYNIPLPADFFATYPQYSPDTLFNGADKAAIAKGKDILIYGFTHEPFKYIYWYTFGKLIDLYLQPFYWKAIFGISIPVVYVLQVVLCGFSIAGIIKAIRNHMSSLLPLYLILIYLTGIYMPFIAFSRYGYPNMSLLILFAAYFFVQRKDKLKNKPPKPISM